MPQGAAVPRVARLQSGATGRRTGAGLHDTGDARAVSGMTAATFVPNAIAVAGALISPAQRGRGVAIVFGGFTLALVLDDQQAPRSGFRLAGA